MAAARSAVDMLVTMLFPRSASQPWRLRFDSPLFECDFSQVAFLHERQSLLHAIVILTLIFAAWFIYATYIEVFMFFAEFYYYPSNKTDNQTGPTLLPYVFGIILAHFAVVLTVFVILFYNCRKPCKCRILLVGCSIAAILSAASGFIIPSTLFATIGNPESIRKIITPIGVMALHALTVFTTYTLMTIPFAVALAITTSLSIALEICLLTAWKITQPFEAIIGRLLLYLVIHLISLYARLVYETRLRTGFWYGAQSLIGSQRLDVEKKLRQKLILSIMPQAFAEFVFSPVKQKKSERSTRRRQHGQEEKRQDDKPPVPDAVVRHNALSEQILSAYKPKASTQYWLPESSKSDLELLHEFHVEKFENVSIIFANICGFTTISSKKSPEEWVPLLNEIFDRFDAVCWSSGCEKISILGDRYICLSGCPTPREDHAHCCIEAGFGMCKVIEEFNANHHEALSIHVGIHSGTIQAGLFGTKRYKFDIWGDDCNFCDDVMDSSNQPGRVLISADTHPYVKDDYTFEAHREIYDFRKSNEMEERFDPVAKRMVWSNKKTTWTYFITGRNKKCRFQEKDDVITVTSPVGDEVSVPLLNMSASSDAAERGPQYLAPVSFTHPPVQPVTLCFTNQKVESEYNTRFSYEPLPAEDRWSMKRSSSLVDFYAADGLHFSAKATFNSADQTSEVPSKNIPSPNKLNIDHKCQLLGPVFPNWVTYGDNVTSLVTAAIVTIVCITAFPLSVTFIAIASVSVIVISLLLLIAPALPSLIDDKRNNAKVSKCFRILQILASGLFASFPAIIALASFSCQVFTNKPPLNFDLVYMTIVIVSLLHFTLFAQVPYYVRTTLAVLTAAAVVLLLKVNPCSVTNTISSLKQNKTFGRATTTTTQMPSDNISREERFCALSEVILSLSGIVIAVCFVARRSELASRLTIYTALEARLMECAIRKAQKRNDDLLAYVVPMHVLTRFSEQQIYYQHHPNCGVIVVRIVNFADYYEESFSGRDGSLHVLNKIFTEFEALLEKRRFKDVEKVKTSVPNLLCAAGLDAHRRTMQRENSAHLYALMAYSFELIEAMRKFNEERQFKFKMRIGFDIGDLVSGILGSTLLHYDVWGDTVNFANKMCLGDTGQDEGVIQVSEAAVELLQDRFNFREFETIAMSGKGDIKTYLAVSEKPITYKYLVPPPGSNPDGVVESVDNKEQKSSVKPK